MAIGLYIPLAQRQQPIVTAYCPTENKKGWHHECHQQHDQRRSRKHKRNVCRLFSFTFHWSQDNWSFTTEHMTNAKRPFPTQRELKRRRLYADLFMATIAGL